MSRKIDPITSNSKKRERSSSESYTPSITSLSLFKLFLEDVYTPFYRDSQPDYIRMYTTDKYRGNTPESTVYARFEYEVYLGNQSKKGIKITDNFFRELNAVDIKRYLEEHKDDMTSFFGENYVPPEIDSLRKALDRFCVKRYLIKCDSTTRVKNKKWFFPNESKDSFKEFVKILAMFVNMDTFKRYSFIFKTEYFRLCLNKQFVLDTLRDAGLGLYLAFNIPDAEDSKMRILTVKTPLAGRYPKNYEDLSYNGKLIRFIKMVGEFYGSKDTISPGDLESHFFGVPPNNDPNKPELPVSKESTKMFIDKLCSDLETDLSVKRVLSEMPDYRKYTSKIDDRILSKVSLNDIFNADPDGTYREEDPWSYVQLTDSDKKHIKENLSLRIELHYETEPRPHKKNELCSNVHNIQTIPVGPEECEDYIENFSFFQDVVLTPILSLIQFSPNALFYFVCEQDKWMDSCCFGEGNKRYLEPNKLLDVLTKKAITDHLNNMSVVDARYPIKCICAGNMRIGNQYIPSVLTFRLGEYNMVSLSWSETIPARANLSNKSQFEPSLYENEYPRYSQRALDIVKMSFSGSTPYLQSFLIKAITEYDQEWKKSVS